MLHFRTILYPLLLVLFIILSLSKTLACDTTPTLTGSNVIDNGDGTYYMDISACIGSGGSADGFDLYFNNDINVLATTVTQVTSPTLNNIADVSVENGIWLATFDEFNNSGTYFETGGFGIECIDFGIIVDSNPEGSTICSLGINEDCLGFTQQTEFITCGSVPGPCLPNYIINDAGTVNGDVIPAGQNCNFAPLNDEIIELNVSCAGNFNFDLTQTASTFPGESWLTVSLGCCSAPIEQTISFFEPNLNINTFLDIGTYYVVVDIYSDAFTPGNYTLDISSDSNFSLVEESNAGQDLTTCESTVTMNGNNFGPDETGLWTVISGSGLIDYPNDPITTISNLSDGENIFQWQIFNDCVSSEDIVTVNVANNVNLDVPNIFYCLEEIPLNVIGGNSDGLWSVTPNFNIEINDINSDNTFAVPIAYGDYLFTYTTCGEEFTTNVSIQSIEPVISSDSETYYCLDSFQLNVDVEGDPGYWDYEGPYIANFNNITSNDPIINVEGYGTYTFTYYGCGTSSEIIINMDGILPTIDAPSETFCLQTFELTANVDGDPGYWDYEGPGNMIFSNQNELITSATVDEYGTYVIYYNGCGLSSTTTINSLETQPEIIYPPNNYLTINCELNSSLEAIVLGDSGYWDFLGPGNAIFDSPNDLYTNVSVDEYGEYIFTYYGCGSESESVVINFNALSPQIDTNNEIFCKLSNQLNAIVDGNVNVEWFVNSSPNNSTVNFSNPNSPETEITVSEYGYYEIGLNACGSTAFSLIKFSPIAPNIIAPSFQSCVLSTTLIAFTEDETGGGPWTQTAGFPGASFDNPNTTITNVTVPNYGIYEFSFQGCDTISNIVVGFECPLVFPNSLTPNGDGNNDYFIIENLNSEIYSNNKISIFNRWGILIFTTSNYGVNQNWWDGKKTFNNEQVNDGVYYYVLETFNRASRQKEEYTGEINIFISNSSSSNNKNDELDKIE